MSRPFRYGGQALIEAVMMRGKDHLAIAVRKPGGEIHVKCDPINPTINRFFLFKWPFFRGIFAFFDSLILGIQALTYSANQAGLEEEEELSGFHLFLVLLTSLGFAILLFFIAPTLAVRLISGTTKNPIVLNLFEGLIRLLIFFIYIVAISRLRDIQRVFAYHGAEHKTVHCYEAGRPLEVAEARAFSTLHPRCGTSFLLIVMVVSILVFSFLGWPSLLWRILSRLILLPLVAGISYEIIRLAGEYPDGPVAVLTAPGLFLQKFTTREPDDSMLEVAIAALKTVLEAEKD